MSDMTPDAFRARFHALGKQREDIIAKAKPARDAYEAALAKVIAAQAEARPLLDALKTIEGPLFEIDSQRAMLSRALAGNTGEPS
jgi:hypothetical protein